jgi:hypothetical protein
MQPPVHVQYERKLFAKVEPFSKLNCTKLSDLEFDMSESKRSSGRGPATLLQPHAYLSLPRGLPSALVGADRLHV